MNLKKPQKDNVSAFTGALLLATLALGVLKFILEVTFFVFHHPS